MPASSSLTPEIAKPKSPRRWFRFSLATLFLVLTIGCICLGVIVNRAHRQQRAAAMVARTGFLIQYSYEIDGDGRFIPNATPPGPAWLRDRLGIEYFGDIVSVAPAFLTDTQLSDRDLACLRNLSKLRSLSIPNSQITDAGCSHFYSLPALEYANLSNSSFSDAGLAHLKYCRHLQSLVLDETPIHGKGFAGFSSNSKLVALSLNHTPFDDSGMEFLAKLPNLEILHFNGTKITDRSLALLSSLPLEVLCIEETRVTSAGLAHLRSHPTLKHLMLDETDIGDDGVVHLATMPLLNNLWIRNEYITEACFDDLMKCQSLTGLVIDEKFSPEAVARLKKGLPNCTVSELSSGK